MGIINTLAKLNEIADPDLSSIATKYIGWGTKTLRRIAPFYISSKDMIVDKKYKVESLDGQNVIRPKYAKSGYSNIEQDKINIYLEERQHKVELDHQDLEEDMSEVEAVGLEACTYPVIESLVYETNALLHDNSNFDSDREVDVDATGTAANSWGAPTTCTPLTNIREGFDKMTLSGRLMDSDTGMKLLISPYLAKLVINSDEYKDEVSDRKIIEPVMLEEKLRIVLGRDVILAEGYYYGEGGGAQFTADSTCHIIYVEMPSGPMSDVQRYRTNNSTLLVGLRNLELTNPPTAQRIGNANDDIFRLSGNIIATWGYTGEDQVTEFRMKSLLRGTVWIHNLPRLVRLKDIVV